MLSAINIAMSGMLAASRRVKASAANLAEVDAIGSLSPTGPRPDAPEQVVQSTVAGGGVAAREAPITPAFLRRPEPGSRFADAQGMVAMPNVDLIAEVMNMVVAKRSFTANARVEQTASDMMKTLYELDEPPHR